MISNKIKFEPDNNSHYLDDLPLVLNSLSLFFPEGNSISSPSTHKYYELTYVVYGELNYIMDDEVYNLKPGSTIVVWPGVSHSYEVLKECEVACIYFSLDYQIEGDHLEISDVDSSNKGNLSTDAYNGKKYKYSKPKYSKSKEVVDNDKDYILKYDDEENDNINTIVLKGKGKEDIAKILEAIIRENGNEAYGKVTMLQALALQLLVQVNRSLKAQVEEQRRIKEGSVQELVEIAKKYIEDNYTKNITVQDMADHVFLSAGYFSRAFSKEVGDSPMNFLTNYRLLKAKDLLENTDLKVNSISRLTGFTTPQRFNSAFRKVMKSTPSDYRRDYHSL